MAIIEIVKKEDSPFAWIDLNSFPDSHASRVEIYIDNPDGKIKEEMVNLFFYLFSEHKNELLIFQSYWWDFTIETWNIESGQDNYFNDEYSEQTKKYLSYLKDSEIPLDFTGSCKCNDWDAFLDIIIDCILSGKALYSPLFYSKENDFFFYFHHTGSIGFYYRENTLQIQKIFEMASRRYLLQNHFVYLMK